MRLGATDLAKIMSPARAPDDSLATVLANKIESDLHSESFDGCRGDEIPSLPMGVRPALTQRNGCYSPGRNTRSLIVISHLQAMSRGYSIPFIGKRCGFFFGVTLTTFRGNHIFGKRHDHSFLQPNWRVFN
jgi:hypothetical protein